MQKKEISIDAQKKSQLAKEMRTAPTHEQRSAAARALSNSRTAEQKTEAAKKGGHSSRRGK